MNPQRRIQLGAVAVVLLAASRNQLQAEEQAPYCYSWCMTHCVPRNGEGSFQFCHDWCNDVAQPC